MMRSPAGQAESRTEFGVNGHIRLPGSLRMASDVGFVCSQCKGKKHYNCVSLRCACPCHASVASLRR